MLQTVIGNKCLGFHFGGDSTEVQGHLRDDVHYWTVFTALNEFSVNYAYIILLLMF